MLGRNIFRLCQIFSNAPNQAGTTQDLVSNGSMTPIKTHYEILSLPPTLHNEPTLSAQLLRSAYRRALLQNHPDKTQPTMNLSNRAVYSIDQISDAFNTLSDPKTRAQYDKGLKVHNVGDDKGKEMFRTGVEVVDLDDLEFDAGEDVWFRGCRCGDERGFELKEGDLEDAVGEGEVSVGCKGCSLWLKVQFGVVEDDAEAQDAANHGNDMGSTKGHVV